jgi:hypothetical protein
LCWLLFNKDTLFEQWWFNAASLFEGNPRRVAGRVLAGDANPARTLSLVSSGIPITRIDIDH